MKTKKTCWVYLVFLAGNSLAQFTCGSGRNDSNNLFHPVTFCKTFVSEIENCLTKFGVDYSTNSKEYDMSKSKKTYKVFQSTSLGVDFPLYARNYFRNGKPLDGFGISAPVSFHLWWDPLEASTSPVLNTDYRFGTVNFKFIRYLENRSLKNISLKLAPFNHESTHIGDELTTFRKCENFPITRVNVSYEYSELQVTLNDPNGTFKENHSLRVGFMYRVNGSQDFYTMSSLDGDSTKITPTRLKSEFYCEYQWIRTKGILTGAGWINVMSIDLRSRIRYNYPTLSSAADSHGLNSLKQRTNSVNIYYGWKYVHKGLSSVGFYIHAYAGINPNGQFRNQDGFRSLGLSLILE
jgi:hypothetical protein